MEYCLITGPSSGIGYELAKKFAENKVNLVLVSRKKKKLEEIKKQFEEEYKIKCLVISNDLSVSNSGKKVYDEVKKNKIKIKYLVNNAGFGSYGLFRDLDIKSELKMIDLNIRSLVEITHLFIPDLIKNKGRIMNLSSIAAFQPIPTMATYASTKSFVLYFSESLREELSDSGVSVSCVCPGMTKTNFQKEAGIDETSYGMEAEEVAEISYDKFMQGKGLIITGPMNRISSAFGKLLPSSFSAKIAKQILKK